MTDLSDQIRITVVATGFDETRARLAKIGESKISPIQGVVSEKPGETTDEEDEKGEEKPEGQQPPEISSEEDQFGEKFEIPAFLRRVQ